MYKIRHIVFTSYLTADGHILFFGVAISVNSSHGHEWITCRFASFINLTLK